MKSKLEPSSLFSWVETCNIFGGGKHFHQILIEFVPAKIEITHKSFSEFSLREYFHFVCMINILSQQEGLLPPLGHGYLLKIFK